MAEYIKREAALIICEKEYKERVKMQDWCGDTVAWNIGNAIKSIPAADVAPVEPELRKTVKLLRKEYEKAKRNPIVRAPVAYALYQTWKAVDGSRMDGK